MIGWASVQPAGNDKVFMSMKILHIFTCFSKGGAERVAIELANQGVREGHDVTIVAAWKLDPAILQNQVIEGVKIVFISENSSFAYFKLFFWILAQRKFIKGFDILHSHLTYGAVAGSIVYIFLKKLLGYKRPIVVETNHAVGMAVPKHKRWLHSRLLLARDGVAFMASDAYWNEFMRRHPRIKFKTILNGISNQSQQLKIDKGSETDSVQSTRSLVVGTVGLLRPDRKPWLYIPIFSQVQKALGAGVKFIIAGDGLEQSNMYKLREEYGMVDLIHMPGLVANPKEVMQQMDLYVSLGVRDIAGISMIEAAMCKVPVVGIQVDASYTTKEEDWFWSHTDTKKVAEKMIELLQQEELRSQVAHKQYSYVNTHFTSKAMFEKYKNFYEELINQQ